MNSLKALWARVEAHLTDDWKRAHKFWSVRLGAVAMLLEGIFTAAPGTVRDVWNSLPGDLKAELPTNFVRWIAWGLLFASLFARVVKQKEPCHDDQ